MPDLTQSRLIKIGWFNGWNPPIPERAVWDVVPKYAERINESSTYRLISCSIDSPPPVDLDLVIFHELYPWSYGCHKWLASIYSKYASVWTCEPPEVNPLDHSDWLLKKFMIIMDNYDHRIDGEKFFPLKLAPVRPIKDFKPVPLSQKKFLCFMGANKNYGSHLSSQLYNERRKIIDYFDKYSDIDIYGPSWEKVGFKNYKGYAIGKEYEEGNVHSAAIDTLAKYKYRICFENSRHLGYIDPYKLHTTFNARCVPIYLGAPNVNKYIPTECYIDAGKFKNYRDLYEYLQSVDDNRYNEYVGAIENYINGDEWERYFGVSAWERNFLHAIDSWVSRLDSEIEKCCAKSRMVPTEKTLPDILQSDTTISRFRALQKNRIWHLATLNPTDGYFMLWKGLILENEGKYVNAQDEFREAIKLGVSDDRLRRYIDRVSRIHLAKMYKSIIKMIESSHNALGMAYSLLTARQYYSSAYSLFAYLKNIFRIW